MLIIAHSPKLPDNAELARAEIWLDAQAGHFVVAVIAVLTDGMRLFVGSASGCPDEPAAMNAAVRLICDSRLGQAFVNYHWGHPALAPATQPDLRKRQVA